MRGNREIALLSNLMNVAIERGLIDANPCKRVKKNSERARTEAPEPAELRAFLDWLEAGSPARKTLALMAEFAALAGSRRVEFLALQVPQIDMQAGEIRLMRAKQHGGTKRAENIAMGPAMLDLAKRLLQLPRPETSLHVFINQHGSPLTESGFTTGWQRAMVEALETKVISQALHLPRPAGVLHDPAQGTVWRPARASRQLGHHGPGLRPLEGLETTVPGLTSIPKLGIKQKPRYLYDSAASACLLVGPARFELATNGLKAACSLRAMYCFPLCAAARSPRRTHGSQP